MAEPYNLESGGEPNVAIFGRRRLSLITQLISDYRRDSRRVAELLVWPHGCNAVDLATRSGTSRDTHRQHGPCIAPRLRYCYSDRCTHQLTRDDVNSILQSLSSCPSDNLHLLPNRGRHNRRNPPSRSPGKKARTRDTQRKLLDRPGRRGWCLASGLD